MPDTDKPHGSSREKSNSVSSQDMAIRGWAWNLAIFVIAAFVIEAITGLWIYLAPFSIISQLQVLLHTGLGLILLVPYAYYQTRHFLSWYRQNATAVMVLGYALMVMAITCLLSGIVLTWQAAFGSKISSGWDLVHLVTGLAAFALTAIHPLMAYTRRRPGLGRVPDFTLAVRRFFRNGLAWLAATVALLAAGAFFWPSQRTELPLPEGYTLPGFAQQFDEYRGSPFAPTYARTESGNLINPDVLSNSESCGSSGCHEQILAEWQPSAHRFSAMNPPYLQVQKNFAQDREPAETRYCAGCHNPISLFAGKIDIQNLDLSTPGVQEGASCAVCHSISKVDQRGNADYVLTPPQKYLWEATEGWKKYTSDFLIRAYPRQHLADYDRTLLRTPEFCGACHKQFIPEALNRFGMSPGQNQYDEWRQSHWHVDNPDKNLSCRDCHMRLVYDSQDPGRGEAGDVRRSADDNAHRHHGTIGTNMFMPAVLKLPHWQEQVRLTREWIRGETVLPEIAHLWPEGPVATIKILGPPAAREGETVLLRVVVENKKAGHNFITGPLDFTRAWVHLVVTDATGKRLAEWGGIDPVTRSITDVPGKIHQIGNSRQEGTMVLEAMPLDEKGNPLIRHELWKKAGGEGLRVIFPRYSDNHIYRFKIPSGAKGPLSVRAELNFRRYRQEFLDLVVPDMERESGVYQPTETHSTDEKQITLNSATRVRSVASPAGIGDDE